MDATHVARLPSPLLRRLALLAFGAAAIALLASCEQSGATTPTASAPEFHLVEARIADIQNAILARELTATDLVKLYLARIKAYNGACVSEPQGILGPIETIPNAGQIN